MGVCEAEAGEQVESITRPQMIKKFFHKYFLSSWALYLWWNERGEIIVFISKLRKLQLRVVLAFWLLFSIPL